MKLTIEVASFESIAEMTRQGLNLQFLRPITSAIDPVDVQYNKAFGYCSLEP